MIKQTKRGRRSSWNSFCYLIGALIGFLPAGAWSQAPDPPAKLDGVPAPRRTIPERIDPAARYLFYLHGKIVEEKGVRPTDPRFGVYEYEEILGALEKKGFTVISEARPRDTDVKQYAAKVVGQINALLKAGLQPDHITVVGASKGAVIAMVVSTGLRNKKVNFVLMSNCNEWVDKNFTIDLHGNVLSIYDVKDEFGQTCQRFFDKATGLNRRKEVEFKIGTGHAILYRPLKEWVDLVEEWARDPMGKSSR